MQATALSLANLRQPRRVARERRSALGPPRARAAAMQPQDMPLQMDPAASRPVAAPLPAPKTPAQQREAEKEVASALEMIPGRLYHYGAKWAPVDTSQ